MLLSLSPRSLLRKMANALHRRKTALETHSGGTETHSQEAAEKARMLGEDYPEILTQQGWALTFAKALGGTTVLQSATADGGGQSQCRRGTPAEQTQKKRVSVTETLETQTP